MIMNHRILNVLAAGALALGTLGLAGCSSDSTAALVVSDAMIPAPNGDMGAMYATITNPGSEEQRIVSASSDVAMDTQIHEVVEDGNVGRMQELRDGLLVPAGGSVKLEMGGYHVMFMDLEEPLTEGQQVEVTLTLADGSTIPVTATVMAR